MPRKPATTTKLLNEATLADDDERVEMVLPPTFAKPEPIPAEAPPPAPIAHLPLDVKPASGDVPEHSTAEWRERLLPAITEKLNAVDDRLAAAEELCAQAELAVALDLDGAADVATEAREAQRLVEIERHGLLRALKRGEAELAGAEKRETAAERVARAERAKALIGERMIAAARFDVALAQLGQLADTLEANARKLSGYADVTRISHNRMQVASTYTSAVYAVAPALAKALALGRDKPMTGMSPLARQEAAHWSMFLPGIKIPAVDGAETASAASVNLDDPALGQYGAVVTGETLTTNGKQYPVGTFLPPEIVLAWKHANRRALASTGRLEFLTEPKAPGTDADLETLLT